MLGFNSKPEQKLVNLSKPLTATTIVILYTINITPTLGLNF